MADVSEQLATGSVCTDSRDVQEIGQGGKVLLYSVWSQNSLKNRHWRGREKGNNRRIVNSLTTIHSNYSK